MASGSKAGPRLALAAMGLLALAGWLLLHPYNTIVHDGVLYTLFALAKLHPGTLDNDIFLRFGSQDSFTLFTPLFASSIGVLGLAHAAALLTLVSQVGLLVGSWLLARRFTGPLEATLGVAALVCLPTEYGPGVIFHYLEGFITPRLPAEALALGALVAALGQRYWTATACVIMAMLLHPIMGVAGAALLILTFVAPARPKLILLAGAAAVLVTIAIAETTGVFARPDAQWLTAVHATSYFLFVSGWSVIDWSRNAIPLGVLAAGWIVSKDPLRRQVCAGALVMALCGLVINLIFCDLLKLSIFLSAQAWRWLWLADVIAVTLAPVILLDCWQRGRGGRTAVILLAGAYLFRVTEPALYLVAAALVCVAVPADRGQHKYWRPIFLGACVVLAMALSSDVIDRLTYVRVADATAPAWLQLLRSVCGNGVIPAVVVLAAWLGLRRWPTSILATAMMTAVAAGACVALLVVPTGAWASWTDNRFTAEMADKFAPWRAQMPARAEVLWPEDPVGTWYLLERPSYWSANQTAGAIFSREKSLLMEKRIGLVLKAADKSGVLLHNTVGLGPGPHSAGLGEIQALGRLDVKGMQALCTDPDLQFIVSWQPLAPTRYPPVVIDPSKPHGKLYLYDCADLHS